MIDFEVFDSFVGLLEWACRFLCDGIAALAEAHRRRRAARRRRGRATKRATAATKVTRGRPGGVVVDAPFCAMLNCVWDNLRAGNFRPWVCDPVYWHGGVLVSADASTADGWGLHAGGIYAAGLWEIDTKAAISNNRLKRLSLERVSISPLELIAQVLLLVVVARSFVRPPNGQFVFRCDNSSSVDVLESRRPHSPAMRRALAWLVRVENHFALRVRAEHIPTLEIRAADAFSHAAVARGCAELRVLHMTPREFPADLVVFDGLTLEELARAMERDVRAALLDRDVEDTAV